MLGLPPMLLTSTSVKDARTGCLLPACNLTSHIGHVLIDPQLDHVASCESRAPFHRIHDEMGYVEIDMAKEVGMEVQREPGTVKLLGGAFTETDLRRMLPEYPTKANKKVWEEVKVLTQRCVTEPDSTSVGLLNEALQNIRMPKGALLRFDVKIELPDGKHVLVDNTSRHCSCASYVDTSIRFFSNLATELEKSDTLGPAFVQVCSPQVVAAQSDKVVKYSCLMTLIDAMRALGYGQPEATFLAPAMAHHGEFSSHLFKLIDVMAPWVYRQALKDMWCTGISPKRSVALFRKKYMDHFSTISFKSQGYLALAMGFPKAGKAYGNVFC